jgi:hypothetical protein
MAWLHHLGSDAQCGAALHQDGVIGGIMLGWGAPWARPWR